MEINGKIAPIPIASKIAPIIIANTINTHFLSCDGVNIVKILNKDFIKFFSPLSYAKSIL